MRPSIADFEPWPFRASSVFAGQPAGAESAHDPQSTLASHRDALCTIIAEHWRVGMTSDAALACMGTERWRQCIRLRQISMIAGFVPIDCDLGADSLFCAYLLPDPAGRSDRVVYLVLRPGLLFFQEYWELLPAGGTLLAFTICHPRLGYEWHSGAGIRFRPSPGQSAPNT